MKRGAGLTRRTPLRNRTPLAAARPLARTAALVARSPMRTTRKPVTAAETAARRIVAARSGGLCEGCRRAPATDWAHRVGRAQGGLWCPSNGLHLCGPDGCHRWSHDNPAEARSVGWIVRSGRTPALVPALLPVVGWALLGPDGSITPTGSEAA